MTNPNNRNSNSTKKGGARLAKTETRSSRKQAPLQKRKKRTPQEKRRRILLILGIALAVILLLAVLYRQFAKPPELEPNEPSSGDSEQLDGTKPYLTGDRKENFYTFLIVGRDTGGGGNTDTIMLASYNIKDQQVALMSIPRDTMVNVSWDVKKINSVYNMYKSKGDTAGIDALEDAVADLIGFQPDYTVTMEWEAVGKIVDAIGGVYFEVPFDMYYRDPYQDLYIDQPAGYRLLNGDDAMQVVRWRKNNGGADKVGDGSDLSRTKVQQDFIAAVIKQCLQIKNVTKINQIAAVFTDYVETELSLGNIVWFAEQALLGGFSTDNMYACTMPNSAQNAYSRSYKAYLSYVVPDPDALIEIVNQYFNPYQQDVTLSNLDIMSVNSDGSVSASSGTVKDAKAAQPVSKPSNNSANTEPVDEEEMEPVAPETPVLPEETTPPSTETPSVQPTQTPEVPEVSPSQPVQESPPVSTEQQPPAESAPVESVPVPVEIPDTDIFTAPDGVTQ